AHLAAQRRFCRAAGGHAADRQLRSAQPGGAALIARAGFALVLLCAACVAPPRAALSPAQSQLADAAARGAALARAGEYSSAASRLEEALRLARALEDVDAIAVNAVNLSIAYQRLGRDDAARRVLAAVTDDSA